ncbi:MAG: hypothetical protein KDK78_11590, partial [Chlamydiia bacterium]|nr:hypothetical protein [Chlamydiia bacterium]
MQKIYIFTHENQYQTKRVFADQFAAALERRGKAVRLISPQNGILQVEDIELLRKHPPDLSCSFNTILPLP